MALLYSDHRPAGSSVGMSHAARKVAIRRCAVAAIVLGWLAATTLSFGYFWHLDAEPGRPATPPTTAPAQASSRPSVIVFLYSKCPCSRAAMAELGRVVASVDRPVDYRIVFVGADLVDPAWRDSWLYRQASALPGARIEADPKGDLAQQFGVKTSGQILAYSTTGDLIFAGGITPSRGHEGENWGRAQLIRVLSSTSPQPIQCAVYGCEVPNPSEFSTAGGSR